MDLQQETLHDQRCLSSVLECADDLMLTSIICSRHYEPQELPQILPLFGFRDVHSGRSCYSPGSPALMTVLAVSAILPPLSKCGHVSQGGHGVTAATAGFLLLI